MANQRRIPADSIYDCADAQEMTTITAFSKRRIPADSIYDCADAEEMVTLPSFSRDIDSAEQSDKPASEPGLAKRLYNGASDIVSNPLVSWPLYLAGSAAIGVYAGPYLAIATRSAFPVAYSSAYGSVPTGLTYYGAYVPAREHLCARVCVNGPKIISTTAGVIRAAVSTTPSVISGVKTAVNSVSKVLGFLRPGTGSTNHATATKACTTNIKPQSAK